MNQILALAVTALWLLLLISPSIAQPRRLMTPPDILRVAGVSDAQISPNGQWVVYTVSISDSDATRSTLWITRPGAEFPTGPPTARPTPTPRRPTDERIQLDWAEVRRQPTQLLRQDWTASTPRWSPDGTMIAFLSNREGQNGIWIVNLSKPDTPRFVAAVQGTNFHIAYAGEPFAWAPDSKRIAYISAVEAEDPAKKSDDPRVIDRIQYKSRTSFSDNRRSHVWIVDIDRPDPRQLTSGAYYDHALSFNPNGNEIAFLSNHEPDPDANNNSDIFAVDISGQVRQLTQTKGCEYEPAWSPDGKWIAYTATKRDVTTIDSIAEDAHVWVISAAGGTGSELTAEQDRRARGPKWSADSRYILFLAGDRGTTTIYRVAASGGRIDKLSLLYDEDRLVGLLDPPASPAVIARQFQMGSFSVSRSGTTVMDPSGAPRRFTSLMSFTLSDASHPAELWFWLGGGEVRRLSAHNDSLVRSMRFSDPEEINFKSYDGASVQGWLIKPAGFREDRKYPLIVSVHGGPHGMSGWGFNPTFQTYAARGYAVLFFNPRGSSGYGQKFSDGTLSEWGGGDYRDLMAGVDEALRRYSWINSDRMGVTGGSYGGFMTNWIITQTPRFKAAVASASVSNLVSFYATSLYQDLIHAEFGGFPWDNYELLWQWSPIRYVRQAQTPTMFIHGELDNDVHITQTEEMYMGLKRRGVETVFVRYPREGHGLREPRHRVDALERTLDWFDRFLK